MDLQGDVTKVSKTYHYVVLNHNRKVHFSTLRPLLQLPEVGTKVHLTNCYGDSTVFALTTNSTMGEGPGKGVLKPSNPPKPFNPPKPSNLSKSSNPFIDYVKGHSLTGRDLVNLDPLITMLEDNFPEATSSETLLSDVFRTMYGIGILLTDFPFPVSHYRRVEIISNKYKDFPYWSFGVYHEQSDLFGYLYIDTTCGTLLLKDSRHIFRLIIPNVSEYRLKTVLDSYVTVSNFKIFTEIYREKSVPNVEYAVAAFQSIRVISRVNSRVDIGAKLPTARFCKSVCFTVLRKSMACIGASNKPEVWFEIAISNGGDQAMITDTCFLILPQEHIKVASMLKESYTYKLFHNAPLEEVEEMRLSRFKPYKILKLSPQDNTIYFQTLKNQKHKKLLSVEECKQHIKTSTKTVSFEGVLTKKMFNDPVCYNANSKKNTRLNEYGTPGVKTHFLVFSFLTAHGTVIYLDCYLNDWENTLMPLGLIPSMRIKVKHMMPQSGKYLKSTPFTSFEVMGYEPSVNFQTVNLYLFDDIDWGKRFFLGKGAGLPYGALIWGRIHQAEILSVKLMTTCQSCQDSTKETLVSRCSCPTKDIACLIKMGVEDQFGQSKILAKNLKLLRLILDFTERQFEIWLRAFRQIGYFEYSIWDKEIPTDTDDKSPVVRGFESVLKDLLKQFNECAIVQFDLKCRLLSYDPKKTYGQSLWFLVDARKNVMQRDI